jgi:hypothetical protein
MKKPEITFRQQASTKYRCPLCKQWVSSADYLFTRRRSASGVWTLVESCRKCREAGL